MLYSLEQAARTLGISSRTLRRHMAAGTVSGAVLVQSRTGPAWRLPREALDALRTRFAVEPEPADVPAPTVEPPPAPQTQPAAPWELDSHSSLASSAGELGGAFGALVAMATQQAAAIAAQAQQLQQGREDALWWRCEALDARQQLEATQARLRTVEAEAQRLRQRLADIEAAAGRVTVPIAQLRQQLRTVEGEAA